MFARFTERSQRVLLFAREEAKSVNYPNIGTEHLLLGLIREGESIAAKVLQTLGLDVEKVKGAVSQMVEASDSPSPPEPSLTARAKKVLELSMDEARRMGNSYVGPEHLLLGLIREGEEIGRAHV